MSTLSNVGDFLSGASMQAATWYNAVNLGTPVVPIATSSAGIAAQQAQLNAQAQANFITANPTLAGILANPVILILIGLGLVALLIYLFKG